MIRCIQIGTTTIQGNYAPLGFKPCCGDAYCDWGEYGICPHVDQEPSDVFGTITNCGTVFRGKPIETVRKETT